MAGKLLIRCTLTTITGMHIGGTDSFSAIGAVNNPVIRDVRTGLPIVPGSSLKGKIRSLLARSMSDKSAPPEEDPEAILRLFGSAKPVRMSRLQFSDCFLTNTEEIRKLGITEVKTENAIDRIDAVANPRQIERVIAGAQFGVCITYTAEDEQQTIEDLKLLASGMNQLQMDYLGGHGSRGSGRVSFNKFQVSDQDGTIHTELTALFDKVAAYELFGSTAGI